jgi:hypothetical protein
MPPEPKAAARRLLRQQGSMLNSMARAMGQLVIGNGPNGRNGRNGPNGHNGRNGPRAPVRETATERVRREETEAALDAIARHREAKERKRAEADANANVPPGEVDASEHPHATVDEVRSFASLHHDDYSGATVSVRFDLVSGGEAWYGAEIDSLKADGSLEVWYPMEEKLEDVPESEVAEGNVRWSRWTAPMVRHALRTAALSATAPGASKVSSMIRRSFEKHDPARAALLADYKNEMDRRSAVVDLTADDLDDLDDRGDRDDRDVVVLDSDDDEAQMIASALTALRKRAGNNNPRVAARLAAIRKRIDQLPFGASRDALEATLSAVEARNGARDELD